MIRYRSRPPSDVELRARLRDLANQRRRFGYRRLFILLREGGLLGRAPATSLKSVAAVPVPVGSPRQKIRQFGDVRCDARRASSRV